MKKQARSLRQDRLAKIYDADILPIWSQRFGKMMLRDLTLPPKSMILDVACGTGYPSLELLRRMDAESRIIAIDTNAPLLDVARKKAAELSGRRVFFRSESAVPRLSFAADVYDLVICNLGLDEVDDPAETLREFARVTKPGGQVLATLALDGTWSEFYDLYREVLLKHDYRDLLPRLDEARRRHPRAEDVAGWMQSAGLSEVQVDIERFQLLFRSAREFFFAPLIDFGPLSTWKDVVGKGEKMQDVFLHIKEALDVYYGNNAFAMTVMAGCARGRKSLDAEPTAPPVVSPIRGSQEEIEVVTGQIEVESILPPDEEESLATEGNV